ncbi:group II intron maturase-specific domain-containing protein [Pseudofrankia sp. BMG5.37]|nr:group II intron maturase-specific domain-containing protein [Pseudofrankia sp. BMG5.36]MDT3445731.1 group II intron maturase-specific domain-containing protein [Pseudofrankia sp. BMG5.37]
MRLLRAHDRLCAAPEPHQRPHQERQPTLRITQRCSLGGVISPCLLNVALHGMEAAAGVRYETNGVAAGKLRRDSPALVRYADDLVALCHSREQAEEVKARLAGWLEPRGLRFNEDKTRVVHISEGFDFLGFHIRRYSNGKLLTRPSKAAMKRIRARLSTEMRDLRGMNAEAVTRRLNPIIKGWAAYYRSGVSSASFSALDTHMWKLTYKWAKHSHPKKPRDWIVKQYFGRFNRTRQDRWVFGDRATGGYLQKFSWTTIARHHLVPGTASPDDPNLSEYWNERRRKSKPPLSPGNLRLLSQQHGRCPICRGLLLHAGSEPNSPQEWEQWLAGTRKAISRKAIALSPESGTPGASTAHRLVHTHCARRLPTDGHVETAPSQPASPSGLLEPCAS